MNGTLITNMFVYDYDVRTEFKNVLKTQPHPVDPIHPAFCQVHSLAIMYLFNLEEHRPARAN